MRVYFLVFLIFQFMTFSLRFFYIFCFALLLTISPVFAAEDFTVEPIEKVIYEDGLIVPEDISWTNRYIITEQKELRVDLEKMRREMMTELQTKELSLVDRALAYSANTLNFFFIFLSIILMGLGLIGWKTLSDTKKSIKNSMEKEVQKIISSFEEKIKALESQQKINILWRQFYSSEGNNEQLEILKKIEEVAPTSKVLKTERSNVYLAMESFDKVIELCNDILEDNFDAPQALYNRAYSYAALKNSKEAKLDLEHLLRISPDYQETIAHEEVFQEIK